MEQNEQFLLALKPQAGKTFDSFYSGDNQIVVDILRRLIVETSHDNNEIRQVYLWGEEASGKSHLLQAVCTQAAASGVRSIYLPFAKLINQGYQVLSGMGEINLLCLDDMEVVLDDPNWQSALFDLLNTAHANCSTLVMAGENNPFHVHLQLKDLQSRIVWGTVHGLKPLTDQGRYEALRYFVHQEMEMVPEETIMYLLKYYSRDIGYLVKLIRFLNEQAMQMKHPVTIPFIKEKVAKFNKIQENTEKIQENAAKIRENSTSKAERYKQI